MTSARIFKKPFKKDTDAVDDPISSLPEDIVEKYEVFYEYTPKGVLKFVGKSGSSIDLIFTKKDSKLYLIVAKVKNGDNVSLESKNLREGIEEVLEKFELEYGFNYELQGLPSNYTLFPVYDDYPLKKFSGKGPNNTFINIKESRLDGSFTVKIQPFNSRSIYHVEVLEGKKLVETVLQAMQNFLHNIPLANSEIESGLKIRYL